jgi:predicted AlkP superfamily phosphohydrolase/phosphomutase
METDSSPSVRDILSKLHKKAQETNIQKVVSDEQKEYHSALSKFGKVIDKSVPPVAELSITQEPILFDNDILNEIISYHLFRQGRFDIAHTFLQVSLKQNTLLTYFRKLTSKLILH